MGSRLEPQRTGGEQQLTEEPEKESGGDEEESQAEVALGTRETRGGKK